MAAKKSMDAAASASPFPFIVQRADQFTNVPAALVDRLCQLEANGKIAILTDGVTSRYTLYLAGTKVQYNGDWQCSAQGPGPEDAVAGALRWSRHDSIIALTSAAKEAIASREKEIEAQRIAEEERRVQEKAQQEVQAQLRAILTERLGETKFKKAQIDLSYTLHGKPVPMQVGADTYKGIGVHKDPHGSRYTVTHIATGMIMASGFNNRTDARMAGMRIADAGDLALLGGREDLALPALAAMRAIALAIRATKYETGLIDPLAQPELDAIPGAAPVMAAKTVATSTDPGIPK